MYSNVHNTVLSSEVKKKPYGFINYFDGLCSCLFVYFHAQFMLIIYVKGFPFSVDFSLLTVYSK